MVRTATATRFGKCRACGEEICPGQTIALDEDGDWTHEGCADDKESLIAMREREQKLGEEIPLASWEIVCNTCWLVHRRGACDRESASSPL